MAWTGAPRTGLVVAGPPRRRALEERLRSIDPMQRSALALAANSAVSSVLGFAYWIAAARFYDASVVGETAAVISTIQLLATVSELNLNNTLVRFLPTAGPRSRAFVARSYLTVVAMSVVIGLAALPFLAGLPLVTHILALGPLGIAIVLVSVPTWSLFALQDGAAIGARAAGWVLTENAVFGLAKLVLLVAFATSLSRLGIFASWLVSMVLVVLMLGAVLFRRLLPRHAADASTTAEVATRRDITAFMTVDNLTLVVMTCGIQLMPVLVAHRAGSADAGYFYAAWSIHGAFDLALINVANSLTVEGARHQDRLGQLVLTTLRRIAVAAVPVVVALLVLAPVVLLLYGDDYAARGADLLRLSALALLPRALVVVWTSVQRVRRNLGRILVMQVVLTTTTLGVAWALVPVIGIAAVGIAYLLAHAAGAAALSPGLVRLIRSGRTAGAPPAGPVTAER
jgi:O-antigen/teichoic acid export membrane protein